MMTQTYRFRVPGNAAIWPRFFHKLLDESFWAVVERFGGPTAQGDYGRFSAYQDQELTRLLGERYQGRVVRDHQKEMFLEWAEEKYYAWFLLKWSER
jgi:hypothetical protein